MAIDRTAYKEGSIHEEDYICLFYVFIFFRPQRRRRVRAWEGSPGQGRLRSLAIASLTDYIREHPRSAKAYINRGYAYVCKTDFAKAITDYSEAIRLSPKEVDAWMGRDLLTSTRASTARLSRICRRQNINTIRRTSTPTLAVQPAQIPLQRSYAKAAIQLGLLGSHPARPKKANAYVSRAAAYYKNREYSKAIEDCTEAIRLDPTLPGSTATED